MGDSPLNPSANGSIPVDPREGIREVRAPLLRWYRQERRDLPWRRTRDPYAIWVSEVMLQQTQVATVVPFFERFLERFPDVASLAAADEEAVLAAWAGLGYYRRARALHAGALAVAERHAGELPSDPEALLQLPGIGRYTAGAIASIAFGLAEPILDGNVRRVLSRLTAFDATGLSRGAEDRELWSVSAALVRGTAPGDLNQALMELGALICSPTAPSCVDCPVASRCRGRSLGRPEAFPIAREKRAIERVRVGVAWIVKAGAVLVERPAPPNPFRGSWDLPATTLSSGDDAATELSSRLLERHAVRLAPRATLATLSHGILHRRLRLEVIDCRLRAGRVAGREDLRWLPLSELSDSAISGATLKVARAVGPVAAIAPGADARASAARRRNARRSPPGTRASH